MIPLMHDGSLLDVAAVYTRSEMLSL